MKKIISRYLEPLVVKAVKEMKEKELAKANVKEPCAIVAPTARLHPGFVINNRLKRREDVVIGEHTHIRGELVTGYNARIKIGDWCYVGHLSRLFAWASITIGNYVLISHMVDIHDTNGHPIDWRKRREDIESILGGKGFQKTCLADSEAIVIEDNVWIGFKASILKGVHIGRGAIIAAGSVVTKDVREWTIVAGNPARVIREIPPEER